MDRLSLLYIGTNTDTLKTIRGFEPATLQASSYEEGVVFFNNHSIDAVLIESLEGMEKPLFAIEQFQIRKKDLLSVIITPFPDQKSLIRAISAGLTDILITPFEPSSMESIIKKLRIATLHNRQLSQKNLLLNQYKNALDASLIISKTDPNGTIIYVNDKFCDISGYTPAEIIGQTHRLFKHPETSKEQMNDLWNTIKAKKIWHGTVSNRAKSGKTFYSDTFIIPILDEQYNITEYMDMRIDVTALHERQRYVQQVLDAQSTMLVVFLSGAIHRSNKRFLDFFNLETLESFSQTYDSLETLLVKAPECLNAELFAKWLEMPHNTREIKIALCNQSGQTRIFKVLKTVLENSQGETEIIISLNDITEMENYLHTLKTKVNEATEAIRDQQQQMIAKSRAAALGEMFDNIAHQWRQPIGAINNAIINAEFAIELSGFEEADILQTFEQIKTYTAFLSKTIDDFREFSNPDKEKILFSLHESVSQTIGIIRGAYAMNRITLDYTPNETLCPIQVFGPQGELSQVTLNILSNARDAIKEKHLTDGHVRIDLSATDDSIILSIMDNAGGIPQTVLPKIFDPYFSTKNKAQGTGIGLYMSKTIIEKNFGGKLEAANKNGGAVFTITLPRATAD